jgi:hypothetical protein
MRDRLIPLLDALAAPLPCFIRDDDAGWDDDRLHALLDVTARAAVPIDLAAIPHAVTPALAQSLRARLADGGVHVHQHGLAHTNHQTEGRKCEFGPARDASTQRRDIAQGRVCLHDHFGAAVDPIFTPPWNRCAPCTPALLHEFGFAALSRDRGARPAQDALPELGVDVDWSRHWRDGGPDALAEAFAGAWSACAADREPFGLMLHHAAMSSDELRVLAELLGAAARHPNLHWQPMQALLRGAAPNRNPTRCTSSA